ncbi:MAG: PEP-utilizing enzyme [Nocardioides sp.]
MQGTPVVPGVAHAPVVIVRGEVSEEAIARFGDGGYADHAAALAAYDEAVEAVAGSFSAKADATSGAAHEVLVASAGLARDKGLRGAVAKAVEGGEDLVGGVRAAIAQFVDIFTAMGGLMAERATDLRDIERRVIAHVVGEPEPGVPVPEVPSVVVAVDLAPSDTATLDPGRVAALVTEKGGSTSHTAIIARQLGLPCIVGAAGVMDLAPGTVVLVDGRTGTIDPGPDPEVARRLVAADREAVLASRPGPARRRRPTGRRSSCWPTSPTASPRR